MEASSVAPRTSQVLNHDSVLHAVRVGLALRGTPARHATFDRKHYFYADLPHGYQITQHHRPMIEGGQLTVDRLDGASRDGVVVRIQQIQLEQDTGKSFHDVAPGLALIDLNRAGTGLMEIVTYPDLASSADAVAFVRKLQAVLRALGASPATMEDGSLRCDVNVSVHRAGEPLGTRCELKNLNSLRSLALAIDYEIARHIALRERNETVEQATLGFDVEREATYKLRSKEEARDYRYMPEPDVPTVELTPALVGQLAATLPELPSDRVARLASAWQLRAEVARALVDTVGAANFFEAASAHLGAAAATAADSLAHCRPGGVSNLARGDRISSRELHRVLSELTGQLNARQRSLEQSPVTPAQLASVVAAVAAGILSGRMAKEILELMVDGDARSADVIAAEKGWRQVSDEGAIGALVDALVRANPDKADAVRSGKDRVLAWFVGQVMKSTKGQANPELVTQLLRKRLER